jgi:hypothetical protein
MKHRRRAKHKTPADMSYLLPAAQCVGLEFSFSAYLYRVDKYHPRKGTFTLIMLNYLDKPIEQPEYFVRHHCTPPVPEPVQPLPCRDNPPVTADNKTVAVHCQATKAPAYYLDQMFTWTTPDGASAYTCVVQQYNAERDAFLLYDPNGCTGSFYREATFVYTHCTPAAEPVVREPLPEVMKFDLYRFPHLLSITAPNHPLLPARIGAVDEGGAS